MAIAFVQAAGDTDTTVQLVNIGAGNLVVVGTAAEGNVAVTGISDGTTAGEIGPARLYYATPDESVELWYFKNHAGGTKTFTVTWASARSFPRIWAAEFSGVALTSLYEGTASATNTPVTTLTTGNITPTPSRDGALIIAACWGNGGTVTAGDVYTNANQPNGETAGIYYIQPTAAAITVTVTQSTGQKLMINAASFLPPAAAGGAPSGFYAAYYYPKLVAEV